MISKRPLILFVAGCLYYSGLVALARWWLGRGERCLLILNYHRAAGGQLRQQWSYLRRHYRTLSLPQALAELALPADSLLDRRSLLALTFDDGYQDNYMHAFPLACEMQLPITIFLVADYISSGGTFWWEERLVRHARVRQVEWQGHGYNLTQAQERRALGQEIALSMSKARSISEREQIIIRAREALGLPADFKPDMGGNAMLNWDEIKEMAASPWVLFGAHTMSHPVLAALPVETDLSCPQADWEVSESRRVLEGRLGLSVCGFAYPYGQPEHIGAYGRKAVELAGYDWAVTTSPGLNAPGCDPLLLRRLSCDHRTHWLIVAAMTCGLWQRSMEIYQKVKKAVKSVLTKEAIN